MTVYLRPWIKKFSLNIHQWILLPLQAGQTVMIWLALISKFEWASAGHTFPNRLAVLRNESSNFVRDTATRFLPPPGQAELVILKTWMSLTFSSIILTLAFTFSISFFFFRAHYSSPHYFFFASFLPFCLFLDLFSLSNISSVDFTHFSLWPFKCPCLYYLMFLPFFFCNLCCAFHLEFKCFKSQL